MEINVDKSIRLKNIGKLELLRPRLEKSVYDNLYEQVFTGKIFDMKIQSGNLSVVVINDEHNAVSFMCVKLLPEI